MSACGKCMSTRSRRTAAKSRLVRRAVTWTVRQFCWGGAIRNRRKRQRGNPKAGVQPQPDARVDVDGLAPRLGGFPLRHPPYETGLTVTSNSAGGVPERLTGICMAPDMGDRRQIRRPCARGSDLRGRDASSQVPRRAEGVRVEACRRGEDGGVCVSEAGCRVRALGPRRGRTAARRNRDGAAASKGLEWPR